MVGAKWKKGSNSGRQRTDDDFGLIARLDSSFIKMILKLTLQSWNVVLNNVPNDLIVDSVIPVDDPVPKGHNPGDRWDLLYNFLVLLRSLTQGLSNNLKLTLDPRAEQEVVTVLSEIGI